MSIHPEDHEQTADAAQGECPACWLDIDPAQCGSDHCPKRKPARERIDYGRPGDPSGCYFPREWRPSAATLYAREYVAAKNPGQADFIRAGGWDDEISVRLFAALHPEGAPPSSAKPAAASIPGTKP